MNAKCGEIRTSVVQGKRVCTPDIEEEVTS